MSKPKRYHLEMQKADDGDWVLYSDYARLKAMTHDDDTCPHLVRANLLEAENARLKAEVERLTLENSQYEEHHKYGQNVITSLREEVEQLTVARNYFIHKMMQKIKEVDRLTKAGDCLVIHIEACYRAEGYDPKDCDMIDNWNAAKEGKPRA